jgi:arginyl-tRNA synthetase
VFVHRVAKVREHLRDHVLETFGLDIGRAVAEAPPNPELGDLAFPFPFELAKLLKRAPRKIAEEIQEGLAPTAEIDRAEAAGGGYINVFLKREAFLMDLIAWVRDPQVPKTPGKVIVEHTNINPNKAAHIGHLRNAVLGDSFVRLLVARGQQVEVQNYIDNTGVQVADVVIGLIHFKKMKLAEVKQIDEPFDIFCWDLYAEVSKWLNEEEGRLELRHQVLREIESREGPTAELSEYVSMRIVRAHLKTMSRIGVRYDVLPRESEILALRFWDQTFKKLKERKAVLYRSEGPHEGCWVMELPEEEGAPADEKVIVRSNGTVTYVGKDIAYQLWKFGLLGCSFSYSKFHKYTDGHTAWVSQADGGDPRAPEFGSGDVVYNVIDVRQAYLQRVVCQALRRLGYRSEADLSTHFSYEMVALSSACCKELDIQLSDEDKLKPYVEVSGRKGLGVKADDLIDKLIEKSHIEVQKRQPDLSAEDRQLIASQVAVGALRYFLLRYTRNTVIAFDFTEALSFEGETGPYLQYAIVRSKNIFRRLAATRPGKGPEEFTEALDQDLISKHGSDVLSDGKVWQLVLTMARTDDVMEKSLRSLEISYLAKHAFLIAQQFNLFYHSCHILSEKDMRKQALLLAVTDSVRRCLTTILELLGMEVPERM